LFGGGVEVKSGAKIEQVPKPEYDGNLIVAEVVYKTNIPTSEEEIKQAKEYDAQLQEQKRIEKEKENARRRAVVKRTATTNKSTNLRTYSKSPRPTGFSACSCVSYAKWKTGINVGSIGYAKRHPINHSTPVVGAIGVMRYNASASGHLFAVGAIEGNRMLISEANWSRCRVTSRWVAIDYGEGFYY
jgi:hypothetical protein